MSRKDELNRKRKSISVLNWMGTLILSAIPGVNLIFFILSLIFAKSSSKRNYAGAALILSAILLLAAAAAFVFFGDELVKWAEELGRTEPVPA